MALYDELQTLKLSAEEFQGTLDALKQAVPQFEQNNALNIKEVKDLHTFLGRLYKPGKDQYYPILGTAHIHALNMRYDRAITAIGALIQAAQAANASQEILNNLNKVKNALDQDRPVISHLDPEDDLSLPESVWKIKKEMQKGHYINNVQKRYPGFLKYWRSNQGSGMGLDQLLQKYVDTTNAKLKSDYEKKVATTPHLYEYTPAGGVLVRGIRNVFNRNLILTFMTNHENDLTVEQKQYLKSHLSTIDKLLVINEYAKRANEAGNEYGKRADVISNGPDHAEVDVHQRAFQSSTNGCWSCAAQMMIQSRGIKNITQEDVRNYRPNINVNKVTPEMEDTYGNDSGKNFLEMGDSILSFAPNTMLKECAVVTYNRGMEKLGVSAAQYVNNTVAYLKKTILHAIKEDRSPVALQTPGHFITIVGIDGDTLLFKNSSYDPNYKPDHTFRMSLKDFVTEHCIRKPENVRLPAIQLSWIADIKLAKDGKTLYGVPSEYASLKQDGTLKAQPADIAEIGNAETFSYNIIGKRIHRLEGDEENNIKHHINPVGYQGVSVTEKVYMPKKMNREYLEAMANKRSKEEEARLQKVDNEYYHIGYPRKHVAIEERFIPKDKGKAEPVNANDPQVREANRLEKLRDDVNSMYQGMKKFSVFRISSKGGYGQIMSSLESLSKTLGSVISKMKKGQNFNAEDDRKLSQTMNTALKQCNDFLSEAYQNQEKNTLFSNKEEEAFQQNRIRAVLNGFEKLQEMMSVLKKDNPVQAAERKQVVEQYRNLLLNERKTANALQDKSFKEILVVPEGYEYKMERLSNVFGKTPVSSNELDAAFPKDQTGTFSILKTMPSGALTGLPAIGSNNETDVLSDRDFTALTFAAAATQYVYAVLDEEFYKGEGGTFEERYNRHGSELCEYITEDTLGDGSRFVKGIAHSRSLVIKALNEYKQGNMESLANLIAEGLNNMGRYFRQVKNIDRGRYLYYSEMGQRIASMMDRDPNLKKTVMDRGLLPKNIDFLKSAGVEGKYAEKSKLYMKELKEIAEGRHKEWTKDEREEKYTDIMMDELLKETRTKTEYSDISIRVTKQKTKRLKGEANKAIVSAHKKYHEKVTKLFSNLDKFKEIENSFKQEVDEMNSYIMSNGRDEWMIMAEKKFQTEVKKLAEEQKGIFDDYKTILLSKHSDQLDEMDRTRASENRPALTEEERLAEAKKLEKANIDRVRFQLNLPEKEKAAVNKVKNAFVKFLKSGPSVLYTPIEEQLKADIDAANLEEQKKLTSLKNKTLLYTEECSEMAKPGEEEKKRENIRNYLRNTGIVNYSAKDFLDKAMHDIIKPSDGIESLHHRVDVMKGAADPIPVQQPVVQQPNRQNHTAVHGGHQPGHGPA